MSGKCFFDTNVLVYCYASTEPEKQSVAVALAQSPDAWISTQVLQELSNTLFRKFHQTWDEVGQVTEEVCQNFHVFTNVTATVREAQRIAARYRFSFYDSLIISAALAAECSILFSEDMKNGQVIDDRLEIKNPFLK